MPHPADPAVAAPKRDHPPCAGPRRRAPAARRGAAMLVLTWVAAAACAAEAPWWPSEWGADDQRGSANRVTPERVLAALRLAREGRIYPIGQPYEADMPI